jgi:hypothetical protein
MISEEVVNRLSTLAFAMASTTAEATRDILWLIAEVRRLREENKDLWDAHERANAAMNDYKDLMVRFEELHPLAELGKAIKGMPVESSLSNNGDLAEEEDLPKWYLYSYPKQIVIGSGATPLEALQKAKEK